MKGLIAVLLLIISASVNAGDLRYRGAIVYVSADPVTLPNGQVGYGQLSAVCVSDDGVYVTAGHGGFTVGHEYEVTHGKDTPVAFTVKCLANRKTLDDKGEGVVVLKDTGSNFDHTPIPLALWTPQIGDRVYAMGYPGGRFAYNEGMIIDKTLIRDQFFNADFRMLEGASGGALISETGGLIGILSCRSQLKSEAAPNTDTEPYTVWIGLDTFGPCVKPYLSGDR